MRPIPNWNGFVTLTNGNGPGMSGSLPRRRSNHWRSRTSSEPSGIPGACGRRWTSFRATLLERSCHRIASLVQEGFRHLLRKEGLITGVELDPEQLALVLRGPDGRNLPPERLSAGERQLLAVAILWALARACGRAAAPHRGHAARQAGLHAP